MKRYLILFLFYSCIVNATIQGPVLNNNQQILDNVSTQTNSITNIENNLNTTTTMLKESISENSFVQNNQNQLENNNIVNDIQLNQLQLSNNQPIKNIDTQKIITNKNTQQTNQKYQLSTYILDINKGQPANNIKVILYKLVSNQWINVMEGATDNNGRIESFLPNNIDNSGTYKLSFLTKEYFDNQGIKTIYPYIEVVFIIDSNKHYHIPITISANSYSIYKGN